jgi:hypothetical protein
MQALTFDPGAAEEWLRSPSSDDPDLTNAERVGIDESTYGPRYEGFLRGLDDVLWGEPPPGVTLRADLGQIGFWLIPDGEVIDQGALITVDLTNGIRLATLHQEIRDFAPSDARGIPALLCAIGHVAAEVCRVVETYEAANPHHRATAASRPPLAGGTAGE